MRAHYDSEVDVLYLTLGVIISLSTASALNWVWAVALILGGAYLVYRAFTSSRA